MKKIIISPPANCHLWTDGIIDKKDLYSTLEIIKTYADDSHFKRELKKCKKCGQLYFFEFYEEIDWKEGNDPQYQTYIPVNDIETADELSKLPTILLLNYLSIRIDWPANADKPIGPYWYNV